MSPKPCGMRTPYSERGIVDSQLILATISSNSLICGSSPSMSSSIISSPLCLVESLMSPKPCGMRTPYSERGIVGSQLILATISSNSLIYVPSPSMTSSIISSPLCLVVRPMSSKPCGMRTPYSERGIADSQLILATINPKQPDIRAISLDDLISNFKSVLTSRTAYVIKAMWDENPLLRAWYSGQPVNLGNNQSQQPDMGAISIDDLISNFKFVLTSKMAYVIKAMWDGNDILHNAIRTLDPEQSNPLLMKVMASNTTGKMEFIIEYVNWLKDASTIRAVLKRYKRVVETRNRPITKPGKLTYYKNVLKC